MQIAYLASRYPHVSHTFIRREVAALRRRGVRIDTFSLRASDELMSELDRQEHATTTAIVPARPLRFVLDHLSAAALAPARYFATLQLALRHRATGLREALWSLFHFGEGILLARELQRRNIDHLHSHFSNAGGTVGMLAAHYAEIGWSLTLHGSADFDTAGRNLLGDKIARARFVACVSYYGRGLAMLLSDPRFWSRIMIVRCGIELHAAGAQRAQAPELGRRLRVLSVGRLSPEKGHLGLIDAFADVVARGIDAELRIVGHGPERKRLDERIAQHRLGDRCSLPGSASEDGVRRELEQADVFAMSSFSEGLPVAIMEAMDAEVAVIAPRLAGIPELVEHGRTGLLFVPTRWSELADGLHRLLTRPEERIELTRQAKERVRQEFDIERAVEPLLAKLQETLPEVRRP